jgi:hypothetical protein
MSNNSPRKFTILDGMILVAAMAFAMTWTPQNIAEVKIIQNSGPQSPRKWAMIGYYMIVSLGPCLTCLGLSGFACRLLGPKTPLRRLVNEPGMVVNLSVVFVFLFELFVGVIGVGLRELFVGSSQRPMTFFWVSMSSRMFGCAMPISVSWSILVLTKRWRSRATWIDRLGIVTGVFWILCLACRNSLAVVMT